MNRDNFLYCELPQFESCTEELRTWFQSKIPNIDFWQSPFTFFDLEEFNQGCAKFKNTCDQHDCEASHIVMYGIQPGRVQPENEVPHTDHSIHNCLGLNFSIQNCAGTHTGMYDVIKGEKVLTELPNGVTYWKYNDDCEFTEITRFDLSKPTLFNTHIPHRVVNPGDNVRISASIRFKLDPWHLTTGSNSVTINKKG